MIQMAKQIQLSQNYLLHPSRPRDESPNSRKVK